MIFTSVFFLFSGSVRERTDSMGGYPWDFFFVKTLDYTAYTAECILSTL